MCGSSEKGAVGAATMPELPSQMELLTMFSFNLIYNWNSVSFNRASKEVSSPGSVVDVDKYWRDLGADFEAGDVCGQTRRRYVKAAQ